jgi:hypothetical protein
MFQFTRAIPLLAFVACGGGATLTAESTPAPDAGDETDAQLATDGGARASASSTGTDASTEPDVDVDAKVDADVDVDAGPPPLCAGDSRAFNAWALTDGQCVHVSGGTCVPAKPGFVAAPDCSKLAACGCFSVCGGTRWLSDDGVRTLFTSDASVPACP